jgi:hypothetical protein
MRGYRMARGSHGTVNSGISGTAAAYYYECILLPGPTAQDIAQALPPNARLGPSLQRNLQKALLWEEEQKKKEPKGEESEENQRGKKRKLPDKAPPKVGGHVRLGWSMRTGDLQAPVGYDKWSYGSRHGWSDHS